MSASKFPAPAQASLEYLIIIGGAVAAAAIVIALLLNSASSVKPNVSCFDGIDNDNDGFTDMADSQCRQDSSLGEGTVEIPPAQDCGNGTCDAGESCSSCPDDCGVCLAKAFPEAEGFGANAKGGRGGKIVFVTTIEDYKKPEPVIEGSLRWAIEEEKEPRMILFKTGGTINLKSPVVFDGEKGSYITIAGQTAPGDGIQIAKSDLHFENGAHDIVIRYIRTRITLDFDLVLNKDGTPVDGYNLLSKGILILRTNNRDVHDIIFDHCSFEWGNDDMLGLGGKNITLQWSIIGEGSKYGDSMPAGVFDGNPNWSLGGVESQGAVFGDASAEPCEAFTAHHNLFINNHQRNMLIYTNGSRIDFFNNYLYNCNVGTTVSQYYTIANSTKLNFIGNVFEHLSTYKGKAKMLALGEGNTREPNNPPTTQCFYVRDNIDTYWRPDSSIDEWKIAAWVHWPGYPDENSDIPCLWNPQTCGYFTAQLPEYYRSFEQFPSISGTPVTLHSASELENILKQTVGASYPYRDSVDLRIINEWTTRTGAVGIGTNQVPPHWDTEGKIVSTGHDPLPVLASGTPPLDTDNDGMPDNWETNHGLNPEDETDGNLDNDNDGYTNIEEYLNNLPYP